MKRLSSIGIAAVFVALSLVAAIVALQGSDKRAPDVAHQAEDSEIWACPMHPEVTDTKPGSCPICSMALVKTSSGKVVPHANQVHVSEGVQTQLGVTLETVVQREIASSASVPVEVVLDESHAINVSPKVEGWIRHLGVSVVGQQVTQGQVLYQIYSPELQQRVREYVDLLLRRDKLLESAGAMESSGSASSQNLMLASVARERFRSRNRLLAADIPKSLLAEIEVSRQVPEVFPVVAERSGVVASISARDGAYVMPQQPILGYSDLSAVWIQVSVTQDQLARMGERSVLAVRTSSSARALNLHLNRRSATIDPATKLAVLRVPMTGQQGRLLPGEVLSGKLEFQRRDVLAVSRDAVIVGAQGSAVVVADGDNHFRLAPIVTGVQDDRLVEVLSGVASGERIVTNGQYLIGAEASTQAARARLRSTSAPAETRTRDPAQEASHHQHPSGGV